MEKSNSKSKKTNQKLNPLSRRKFIARSALTVGAISIIPRHVLGQGFIAPSDKINLGVIGLGKQTNGLAKRFVDSTSAQIVAGCDVWTTKTAAFEKHVGELYAKERNVKRYDGLTSYSDYKELLSR